MSSKQSSKTPIVDWSDSRLSLVNANLDFVLSLTLDSQAREKCLEEKREVVSELKRRREMRNSNR